MGEGGEGHGYFEDVRGWGEVGCHVYARGGFFLSERVLVDAIADEGEEFHCAATSTGEIVGLM